MPLLSVSRPAAYSLDKLLEQAKHIHEPLRQDFITGGRECQTDGVSAATTTDNPKHASGVPAAGQGITVIAST